MLFLFAQNLHFNTSKISVRNTYVIWTRQWEWLMVFDSSRDSVHYVQSLQKLLAVLRSGSALFLFAQKLFFNTFKIFVRNANVIWPMQWEWLKAFGRASVHCSQSKFKEVIPVLQLLPVCCCLVQLLKHGLNARFLFHQCLDVDFSERCKVKRAILV